MHLQTSAGSTGSFDAASSGARKIGGGIVGAIAAFFVFCGHWIKEGFLAIGRGFMRLVSTSRIAAVVVVIALVLGVGFLVDAGLSWNKIYAGVRVGDLDLSGKTVEEASQLIRQHYGQNLSQANLTIFANEDAANDPNIQQTIAQQEAIAEQISVEDARAQKKLWQVSPQTLSATVPDEALAQEALAVGREDGGLGARIAAGLTGREIQPEIAVNDAQFEALADDIDATIGSPREDFGVTVTDGVASVTEGYDGNLVDRSALLDQIETAFLTNGAGDESFVAKAEHAPVRITYDQAQNTADEINRALSVGAQFSYQGMIWGVTPEELGSWISTRIDEVDGGYELVPYVDVEKAKTPLLTRITETVTGSPVQVTMNNVDGTVMVTLSHEVAVPLADQAIEELSTLLFGPNAVDAKPTITVDAGTLSGTVNFDQALGYGVINEISSYTTEYVNSESTQNRLHNIQLAASLLNDSIVKADGGTWSFNEVVGDCNAEKGFLGAGAIIDNEYDDAVGGGICQVATTVFNAVYEAGFPVNERHNHTLYIASYPAGRDAAIAYPDMDLVWTNDTDSDLVVKATHTDTSLTVTLYGVDPNYVVESVDGEWGEGRKYTTRVEVDENVAEGVYYTDTVGQNGSTFVVYRTVKDKDGNLLHEDTFHSEYTPITEVIVAGPNTTVDTLGTSQNSSDSANESSDEESYDESYSDSEDYSDTDESYSDTNEGNGEDFQEE